MRSLPYPGKRPYQNPLDGTDAGIDFDGDSLTMGEEFALWKGFDATRNLSDLLYSDGGAPSSVPVGAQVRSYDLDGNGVLTDDECDEDADGLTNYDEAHGRATPGYWKGRYPMDVPYYVHHAGTDPASADSDGDGVRDGADDQDQDDLPNLMELSRNAAAYGRPLEDPVSPPDPPNSTPAGGYVDPFNPCLPSTASRTCNNHPRSRVPGLRSASRRSTSSSTSGGAIEAGAAGLGLGLRPVRVQIPTAGMGYSSEP